MSKLGWKWPKMALKVLHRGENWIEMAKKVQKYPIHVLKQLRRKKKLVTNIEKYVKTNQK